MKHSISHLLTVMITLNCCSQQTTNSADNSKRAGGPCEGCEAIHESPVKFKHLPSVLKLPGYDGAGTKIEINGIIYKPDGKTTAADVVLYVYHTDQTGHYSTKGE